MRRMTSDEIRETWFRFFESKGHKKVDSAPLVPINDDSLLWINAGVAPLKKYFDGSVVPENRRIVNIQKCIRTNDIENVGVTKRHQTFFEMMGNFSIGDYFKNEAIEFAFELLTSKEYFAIPKEKLYVTIYTEDMEARDKWIDVGFIPDHIVPLDENFWEIGEGPCGPDSEIFFDRGEKYDYDGKALEHFKNDVDQERYIEIWNNVFSQFNSKEGVPRSEYKELPSKNIDTGAGLERWACIFQDVDSNFDTDLFTPIIKKIEELTGVKYDGQMEFKVIADHIRAITMALSDGAVFDNVGRGYVLRRLLRRSVRMGKKLGMNEPFMHVLVDTVVSVMKNSYPDVVKTSSYVKNLVLDEEKLFHKTLAQGEKRLIELMEESQNKKISGQDVFKLYDTYGFPYELTLEILEEKGFSTEREEFDKCMREQKELAKSSRKQETTMNSQNESLLKFKEKSEFLYDKYKETSGVIALFNDEEQVESLSDNGYVILDNTCFYAESGGQVADTGMLIGDSFKARVIDVQKTPNGQNIHKVKLLDGTIKMNDKVTCNIDSSKRDRIEANHTSVHLLQYALQTVVSDSIKQAGSKVDDKMLRFDFTYTGKISDDEIIKVENKVNELINNAIERKINYMSLDEAKELGAMALFSEKYGNIVRVVTFGESKELCGGCHTRNTENIGKFAIRSIESKGSNIFRIVAVTGDDITDSLYEAVRVYNDEKVKLIMKAKEIVLSAKQDDIKLEFNYKMDSIEPNSYNDIISERKSLEVLQEEVKKLEKTYKQKLSEVSIKDVDKYLSDVKVTDKFKYLVIKTENIDFNNLKSISDEVLNKMGKGIVYFINSNGNISNIVVKSNVEVSASDLFKNSTMNMNASGGGSATFAQGVLKDNSMINKLYEKVISLIEE